MNNTPNINIININTNIKTQKNNNNNKNKEKKQDNNLTFEDSYINIGTHNVRGFTEINKQKIFKTWYKDNEIDIIGITETRLDIKSEKFTLQQSNTYKTYWSGKNNNDGGA